MFPHQSIKFFSFFIAAMTVHTDEFKISNLPSVHLLMDIRVCASDLLLQTTWQQMTLHMSFCMCAKLICRIVGEVLGQRTLIILMDTAK